ncbi:MAG: hypothetical protein ACRDQ0_07900 [Pseudonocardia sp.]
MAESPHRLDEEMNARRLELGKKGLNWREVAVAAGLSSETLRAVRQGLNEPTEQTKRGIEQALHWERGSIDSILAGGKPTPLREQPPADGPLLPADDPRRRILDAALEQLTPEQQEAFLRQELEQRQRRGRSSSRAPDERRRA